MEYESRKVKWYLLVLFVIYSGAAAYVLFQGNPYLYSHLELRAALTAGADAQLQTIPAKPVSSRKVGSPTFYSRYNFERTAVDTINSPRSKSFDEFETHTVETGLENWEPQNIAYDDQGFYITGKSQWVVALALDGKARWKFKFLKPTGDKGLHLPLVDEANVYIVHPQGEVAAFDKVSGEIRWILPMNFEVVAAPFLWQAELIVPVKAEKGIQLVVINRADGVKAEKMPRLEIKPGFVLARSPNQGHLIATVDNKVVSIDPGNWTIDWTQTLTEPVRGPAVVVEQNIYLSTLGAKILKLDAGKKGKLDWEVELEKPAATPPAYLPIMARLSFLDTSGALVTLDAKTGKSFWRFGIDNKNDLMETWSARLKGNHIEEFKMDWLHKGWTIWSPCGERRFCIFTPNKGQMISRVQLSGEPLALPLPFERRLVFLTRTKPGQYLISHVVEESEIKAIRKAAADEKAAQ